MDNLLAHGLSGWKISFRKTQVFRESSVTGTDNNNFRGNFLPHCLTGRLGKVLADDKWRKFNKTRVDIFARNLASLTSGILEVTAFLKLALERAL